MTNSKTFVSDKRLLATLLLSVLLVLAMPSSAQEASLRATEAGPYYAHVPIGLQIVATGFDESPQPVVEVDPPAVGTLSFSHVSPNISRSISIVNGRMTQKNTVKFVYHYQYLVDKPGNYKVGPFRLVQGSKTVQTQAGRLEVKAVPVATNQRVKLLLPKGDIYLGQRIPVELEWWVEQDRLEGLLNQRAHVPFFDSEYFQFYDIEEETDGRFAVSGSTGVTEVAASTSRRIWNNKSYAVWSVKRLMVPIKAGEFDVQPTSVTVEEGVRWRRDFFGQRTATQVRRLRVADEARRLTVRALPAQGRPDSFAGAVGRGFLLEVTADRSVVQAGDPISLILTLRGDADVSSASLPPLNVSLPAQDFRVSSEKIAGQMQDGSKHFETTIRVLNKDVREIPPIAYSWFDPQTKRYDTSYSRPIALSVKAAQMVSASDVIRSQSATDDAQAQQQQDANDAAPVNTDASEGSLVRPRFTLSGADLSIEKNPQRLAQNTVSFLSNTWMTAVSYASGLLVMLLALWQRKRADRDPGDVAREKELSRYHQRVASADSVAALSDALRRMGAMAGQFPRDEFDAILSECDNRVFAPGGENASVDEAMKTRALALADQMLQASV